jgi:hypothetical protein
MGREYSKVNKRLHAEGRWDAYVYHREAVKRLLPQLLPDCDPVALGWRVASFRFPPLDGSQHEVPMTDEIHAALTGCPLPMTEHVPPPPAPAPPADGEDEFYLDGDPDAGKYTPASLGLPEPEKMRKDGKGPFIYHEQGFQHKLLVKKLDYAEDWDKLFASIDYSKRCKPFDMIQWVFEHMGLPPNVIDPADVPSPGTLHYLKLCKDNPSSVGADFMKNLFPKTIPDKKQLEHDAKQRDDGRQVLNKLDAFDAEFEGEAATILKMDSNVA